MRKQYIVLLVVTIVHAISATSLSPSVNKPANFDDVDNNANDAERVNVQGISKLADLDKKTWKLRKLDMKLAGKIWVAAGKNPVKLFKYYRLNGAGDKIGEKKRVIQWFRFAKEYRRKRGDHWLPDYEMYTILEKSRASEAKLAALFESLKHIPDVKNLATTMQNYQFKLWIDQGHIPNTVAEMLKVSTRGPLKPEFDPRYTILEDFTKVFTGDTGKKLKRSATIP